MTTDRSGRKLLVMFSDIHSGHKLGLMNPDVVLHEQDESGHLVRWRPRPTAIQDYLWSLFLEHVRAVAELADGAPIILIHNGDLTHGNRHVGALVSAREADQFLIAASNFAPFCELPNLQAIRLTCGTPSHIFYLDSAPTLVAELLRGQYRQVDVAVIHHGLMDLDGVLIDYAHHGPHPGMREWTAGNQLRYYAKSLIAEHDRLNGPIPRVIVRSHYHQYIRETLRSQRMAEDGSLTETTVDVIITPSYCGLTGYARQATRSRNWLLNGLLAIEVEGGRVRDIHPFVKMTDLRVKESL